MTDSMRESLAAAMVETVDVLRGKGTVALLKSEYREWADAILAALPKAAMQELAANEPVLGDRPTGTMGGFSGEPGEMPERLAHETGHGGAAQPAPDPEAVRLLDELVKDARAYGAALRADWSDFDGRDARNTLNAITEKAAAFLQARESGGEL